MIEVNSFINSVGDYAFDCELRHDMLLRCEEYSGQLVRIGAEITNIVVTADTMIMTERGLYKRAYDLHVGDCLKSYISGRTIVTGVCKWDVEDFDMVKIVDCKDQYLIVNGFYVACDE